MPNDVDIQTRLINQQQLRRMMRSRPGYTKLEATLGPAAASLFTEVVFESELSKFNPDGRYIELRDEDMAGFDGYLDQILEAESEKTTRKRVYAQELLEMALQGGLHGLLDLKGADWPRRGQYRIRPETMDAELRQAARWISDSMYSHPYDAVLKLLEESVTDAPPHEVLGADPMLLDRIHRRLAPEVPRHRGPNPEVSYPSSVGGRMLLETVLHWTAEAEWPPPGDLTWYDVALFYLGAIGTVQGYPDGNKRVARAAYAITLLRNRCQFHAPDRDHLNVLFSMEMADGE